MTKVLVDDMLLHKLHNLVQPLELCDDSGRILGRFFPVLDLSEYEAWEPTFSEEELQQTEQETTSFTTAEVLAHLQSLPCSKSDGNSQH